MDKRRYLKQIIDGIYSDDEDIVPIDNGEVEMELESPSPLPQGTKTKIDNETTLITLGGFSLPNMGIWGKRK